MGKSLVIDRPGENLVIYMTHISMLNTQRCFSDFRGWNEFITCRLLQLIQQPKCGGGETDARTPARK